MEVFVIIFSLIFISWIFGAMSDRKQQKKIEEECRMREEATKEVFGESDIEEEIAIFKKANKKVDETFFQIQEKYFKKKEVEIIGNFDDFLGKCPKCKKGMLVKRKGKYGKFLGCTSFPTCSYTKSIKLSEKEYKDKVTEAVLNDIKKAYT